MGRHYAWSLSWVNRRAPARLGLIVSVLAGPFGLAGCGGAATSAGGVVAPPATSTSLAAPSSGQTQSAFTPVGTISESDGDGTTLSQTYALGAMTAGSANVPAEVLNACNADNSLTAAETVFTAGSATLSYPQGSLPVDVTVVPTQLVAGSGYIGSVAFDIGGTWQCGIGDSTTVNVSLDAGQSQTVPIWVLSQVLSNAQPSVPAAVSDGWSFATEAVSDGEQNLTDVTASGPNAVTCDGTGELYLFQAHPTCS